MKNTKNKPNFLDLLLLVAFLLSIGGYVTAKSEKTPLNKIIESKENIAIEVLLPDIPSANNSYFEAGAKTAITIRNRPYTKLDIISFESKPKQIVLPNLSGTFKTINDPTKINIKDYYIKLADTALKTNDGYVVGGNKIKIGNQVELEGFNYRFTGKIINIHKLNKQ